MFHQNCGNIACPCSSSSWASCNSHSICVCLGNTIEFYDEQGTLLKTVALGTEREAA